MEKPRTALITGASAGIGEAFARELAARGLRLLLTARRADRLEALAAELRSAHGTSVDVVAADLGTAEGMAAVVEAGKAHEIDLLVNNAGFGTFERFVEIPPERMGAEMALNVIAPVTLARELLPPMIARGHGGIVNLASTAAFQPVAKQAVYSATKAFVLSWSEALWAECRGTGVKVVALCPGPTETGFFDVAGKGASAIWSHFDSAEEVVRVGLRALARDRSFAIVGRRNYLLAMSTRLAPRRVVALASRRLVDLE